MFRVELHYEFETLGEAKAFARAGDTYAKLYGIDPDESHFSWKSKHRGELEYWLRDDLEWELPPERRDAIRAEIRAELASRDVNA